MLRLRAEVAPVNVGLYLLGSLRSSDDPVRELSELVIEYPEALTALEYIFLLKGLSVPAESDIAMRAREAGIIDLIRKRDLRDYVAGFFEGSVSDI